MLMTDRVVIKNFILMVRQGTHICLVFRLLVDFWRMLRWCMASGVTGADTWSWTHTSVTLLCVIGAACFSY